MSRVLNNILSMNELNLKDVEGIGPAAIAKLKKAGVTSVKDIATQGLEELSVALGSTKDTASKYIESARELLRDRGIIGEEFIDGNKALEDREALPRISTGAPDFDDWLKGGFESGGITELYGEYGSGKSQICHVMSVQNTGNTIFMDTEGTFRPERIKEICQARNIDVNETLGRMKVCKLYSSRNLERIVDNLANHVEQYDAKLVIVDSIIALHRSEFSGRGTLAERQQKINQILHRLLRVAEIYKIVVIMTNQITTSPDTFYGDPNKATGGNIIGHASTYRIYLKKIGKNRLATMIDSPYHETSAHKFSISKAGIEQAIE